MDTGTYVSMAVAIVYVIEKIMLKAKKCKSNCCCNCSTIDIEMNPSSPKPESKPHIDTNV